MAVPVPAPKALPRAVVQRPGQGLQRQAALPQGQQAGLVQAVRNISRLSIAPIFHKLHLNDFAAASQLDFFTTVPGGGLAWWLANFRNPYLKQSLTIYGIRMYLQGSGVTATTGSQFRVSAAGEFAIAQQIPAIWNLLDESLVRIKVNDTEHPYIDASKLLAPLKYTEYGYDDGLGAAAYATTFGTESNNPFYMFRKPTRDITPFVISKDDEFSVMIRTPSALPAAANIPDDWYICFELMCQVERTMYAG